MAVSDNILNFVSVKTNKLYKIMEKKDFEKTFEKVEGLNKQLREECCDYLRKVLKENGNSIDLQSEDEDYDMVCVTYDGGSHPEYAANPYSQVYGIFFNEKDNEIYLNIEDSDEYCLDRVYSVLEVYDICLLVQSIMDNKD